MKFSLLATFKTAFSRKRSLLAQIESLSKANADLREKIGAAQNAKVVAENQADDLRKDKERLRSKVAEQKKQLEKLTLVNAQLVSRCQVLDEANQLLETDKTPRRA